MIEHAAVGAMADARHLLPTTLPPACVVTPEGVLLQFRPVGLSTRVVGRLVDLGIQAIAAGMILGIIGLSSAALPQGIVIALWVVTAFLLLFGFPIAFETLGNGRTPGHRAVGTKVIGLDGGPVRFRQAAIRAILVMVDLFLTSGFGGAVSILSTPSGQRLGDIAAGTMVVRLADASIYDLPQFELSPGARTQVANWDLRQLSDADVDLARDLLARGSELRPGAQLDLGQRLSDHFVKRLGARRPSGMTIEQHLQTVVAARSEAGSHRVATW